MNNKTKKTVINISKAEYRSSTRIPTSDLEAGYYQLSANAFKLMTYFYSKGNGWEFNNDAIAITLGLKSIRTVKVLIKELVNKGFLLIKKGEVTNYFVGINIVSQYEE